MPTNRRDFIRTSAGALAAMAIVPDLALGRSLRLDAMPVGLIGAGRQGRVLMGEIQKIPGATIAAVCDPVESRLAAGLRRAPGAQGFADHRALLERDDIQAVFIATPTHLHRAIAEAALAAGKHVYCEAPIAHTIDDAKAIVRAARSSSKVFMPGLEGRSNPVYQLARTFFRSEAVRDLASMRAQQHEKISWRTPVSNPADERALNWRLDNAVTIGLPGEWGTHQFDVFHWYTDRRPLRVRGVGSIRLHDDGRTLPDSVACLVEYEGGRTLSYEATLANSYEGRYEVLYGTNAAIKLAWSHGWMFKEADAPTQGWEVYANRQQFHNDEGITLIADATQLASQGKLQEGVGLPHPSAYYAVEDFLGACAGGEAPPVTAADALRATALGIAAHRAVLEGVTIDITDEMLTA
ncbi:MAG: Gfo/Idh/MocA family oxidoreductase [Phycisphaeraceae bacterium]|nr:Gfo/Idh/MocA family oxidoreductase [Phycisphaeraceae bacterium]